MARSAAAAASRPRNFVVCLFILLFPPSSGCRGTPLCFERSGRKKEELCRSGSGSRRAEARAVTKRDLYVDASASARCRVNRQLTADVVNPFAHADQAEASTFVFGQ